MRRRRYLHISGTRALGPNKYLIWFMFFRWHATCIVFWHRQIRRNLMRTALSILTLGTALAICGTAHATLMQDTDSFGIVWTLESDGVNHGTTASPLYDVFVFADTSGFTASHGGTSFDQTNAYIND